jgi:uncharacterized repeat protein (TIGR01451 family)
MSYPVGASPQAVVVADFNGDGHPDIAVANSGSGNVSVLLNKGDGTFKPAINFDAGMAGPTFIEVADFNNDGKQDLAVWSGTSPVSSTVSILLGKGDGTFLAPKTTPLPAAVDQATLDLAIADFNLDHKPDLAILVHDANGGGSSRILLLAGNGDGTFQAAQQVSDALSSGGGAFPTLRYLLTADFNGDTKPDLAVQVSAGVAILLGQGDGTFLAGATVPAAAGFVATNLNVSDFNVDGRADLLVRFDGPTNNQCLTSQGWKSRTASKLSLFLGNRDGSFQPEQTIDLGTRCPSGSAFGPPSVGDFNGDGRPDLQYQQIFTTRQYNALRLGRTDGAFSGPLNLEPLGAWPLGVTSVAKDLNGDKLSDLIYLDSGSAVVLMNTSPTSGADLALAGFADGSTYTAYFMNNGPEVATAVTFKDTLPSSAQFVSASATQGSCTQTNGVVTCAIGSLAPGFDVYVNVPVTMGANAADRTVTNIMSVAATEPDLAPSDNTTIQNTEVFTLRVAIDGTGSGTVTSDPTGINCPTTCAQGYFANSGIALLATPAPGSVFVGWDGAVNCNGPASICGRNSVTMWSTETTRATFDKAPDPPPPSGGESSVGTGGGGAASLWELCGMLLFGFWRRLSDRQPMLKDDREVR